MFVPHDVLVFLAMAVAMADASPSLRRRTQALDQHAADLAQYSIMIASQVSANNAKHSSDVAAGAAAAAAAASAASALPLVTAATAPVPTTPDVTASSPSDADSLPATPVPAPAAATTSAQAGASVDSPSAVYTLDGQVYTNVAYNAMVGGMTTPTPGASGCTVEQKVFETSLAACKGADDAVYVTASTCLNYPGIKVTAPLSYGYDKPTTTRSVDVALTTYACYNMDICQGDNELGWPNLPSPDQWIGYQDLWDSHKSGFLSDGLAFETAIPNIAQKYSVDPRMLLAQGIQESTNMSPSDMDKSAGVFQDGRVGISDHETIVDAYLSGADGRTPGMAALLYLTRNVWLGLKLFNSGQQFYQPYMDLGHRTPPLCLGKESYVNDLANRLTGYDGSEGYIYDTKCFPQMSDMAHICPPAVVPT